MPTQTRIVAPGPSERTVKDSDGTILKVPADWSLLPPGDAGLYDILSDPDSLTLAEGFSFTNNPNYNEPTIVTSLFEHTEGQQGFLIKRAPLTISPIEATKTFGDGFDFSALSFANKAAIVAGSLKNGNTIDDIGVFSEGTALTSGAGSYRIFTDEDPIGSNGFKQSNYDITYLELADGFSVGKRPLELTPLPQSKQYGTMGRRWSPR